MRWSPIRARPSGLRGRSFGNTPRDLGRRAGLADEQFRSRLRDVGRIARVKLRAAVRSKAIDIVEIKPGRAKICCGEWIFLFLGDGSEIERNIMIDKLSEIGEPGRYVAVTAGI